MVPANPNSSKKRTKKRKATKSKRKMKRLHKPSKFSIFLLGLLLAFSIFCSFLISLKSSSQSSHTLTQNELTSLIASTAMKYGIADHLNELEAIVAVESNGQSEDVFQSSESLGLPPNSLGVYDSIEQGVKYYKELLDKAERLGIDQDSVFQAYNYGSGFLDFIAVNGGKYTPELAQEFSRIYSSGRIVSYPNPIAIQENGGWRYDYGNMFYVQLIHQNLPTE